MAAEELEKQPGKSPNSSHGRTSHLENGGWRTRSREVELRLQGKTQFLGRVGGLGEQAGWQPPEPLCLALSAPRMNMTTSWSTVAGAHTGYLLSQSQNLPLMTPSDLIVNRISNLIKSQF